MYETIIKSLSEWNASHSERSKLQHGYIGLTVATILLAGLIGLIDYDLGQRLTALALLLLGVFFVNLITWTLLSGLLLSSLDERTATKPAVKRKSTVRKKSK